MTQPKPIRYTIDGDARGFKAATKRAAADLGALGRKARATDRALDMTANVDVDDSALGRLRARMLAQRAELERDIETNVDIDAGAALAELRAIERRIRSIDRMRANVDVDVDTKGGMGRGVMKGLAGLSNIVQDGVGNAIQQGVKAASANPYVGAAIGAGIVAAAAAATPVIIAGVGASVGAAVSKGLFDAGKGLLEGYDAIEKSNKRAGIVFGDQLSIMQDWASGLSTDVGLGRQEIVTAASSIQDLLVPRGFSRGKAAEITRGVYERGAAIAEFAGRDTTEGIDAVTKALLGQGKSLTMMGVEIRKADVKKWVKENADEVQGLNEKQAEVVATLALIEANSGDAWTAFKNGGGSADAMLDQLGATMANLKTDAIEGFGRIFVGVLDSIRANLNLDFPEGGLKQWIANNETSIRSFFLNVVSAGVSAAIGTLQFAKALASLVGPALMAGKAALLFAKYLLEVASIVTLPLQLASGTVRDFFTNTRAGLDNSLGTLESFSTAWGLVGPAIQSGLDSGITALTGLQGATAQARKEMEAVAGLELDIETTLKTDGIDAAKSKIRDLSLKQINLLVKTGVIDDKDLQAWLVKYQNKRIDIKLKAKLKTEFGSQTEGDLVGTELARYQARKHELEQTLRVQVSADTTELDGALAGIDGSKTVDVDVQAPNLPGVIGQIGSIPTSKQVKVEAQPAGFQPVNAQLNDWGKQRQAHVQAMTSGFAEVNRQLADWGRQRYVHVQALTSGFAAINAQISSWEDRIHHIYVVRHESAEKTSIPAGGLPMPGPVVSRDAYMGVISPPVARYGASTTISGRGTDEHHLPGSGRTRHVEPSPRQPVTQVNVYLDGRRIAAQLQPATSRRGKA